MTEARIELPPLPRRAVKTAVWSGRPIKCVSLKAMREYARAAVLQERERCARVCEEERPNLPGPHCPWSDEEDARYDALTDCINAIRKGD